MSRGFSNYQTCGQKPASKGAPNRPIPKRIADYDLLKYLHKPMTVLDIGCNRGFFGVALSPNIGAYIGIDHDAGQLKYGIAECRKRGIANVQLLHSSFESFPARPVDVIFSFAVHVYSRFLMCDYASKMYGMLKPGGYIFLEGHPTGYLGEPAKLNKLVALLEGHFKMKRILHKSVIDRKNRRDFYIWQK
jgi:cyclopropane fatty-acyl-phospholipid synthase-like methyltransferase